MRHFFSVFLLLLLLLPLTTRALGVEAAENQITLGTQKPLESPAGAYLNLVYTEAFKRMGMKFVYQTFPAKRSSLLSDSGVLDGELSRMDSYQDAHPNVIRVDPPHWTSSFIVVAADASLQLQGWNSLKKSGYKVTYVAGIKGCEVNLPKVVPPQNLEVVMHTALGYRMVLSGRADLYVGPEMDMLSELESQEFRSSPLRIVGIMETFTGHVFLHKKHRDMVPRLSQVLREMKEEGLFETYQKITNLKFYNPESQ